jgi:aspartate/methionine/tyrosine aminotransferase
VNRSLLESVTAPPIVEFRRKAAAVVPARGVLYDMSQAVPNMPTPMRLRTRLAEVLVNDPEPSFYTEVPGLPGLRGRIASSHRLAGAFGPGNVMVTAGANHAMFTSFLLHFQAGDRVVLLEPYYFNYDMGLKMLGMTPGYCCLKPENGFALRAADVIAVLEREGAKGVVVITPNNPTGAVYSSRELLDLLQWTSPRGIEVILDETYARYDPRHLNQPQIGTFIGKGLTLVGSFSKTYSLTGYRVGYLVAGDAEIRQALKIQDTAIICAPHLSQLAALFGMEDCEGELAAQLSKTADLGQALRKAANELRAFSLASSGAFFAYVRHPHASMTCGEATLELYRNTGILGLPGTVFGRSQESFIRLAFCNLGREDLDAAIAGLLDYDRELAT